MSNENRKLKPIQKGEMREAMTREGRQLVRGAVEVSRKPLHDLGGKLLDYFIDWVIVKVSGSAS